MNTDKVVKESKIIMLVTLGIGAALLATGILFKLLEINLLPKNGAMAIIALSFTPLAVALAYYVKLLRRTNSPFGRPLRMSEFTPHPFCFHHKPLLHRNLGILSQAFARKKFLHQNQTHLQ